MLRVDAEALTGAAPVLGRAASMIEVAGQAAGQALSSAMGAAGPGAVQGAVEGLLAALAVAHQVTGQGTDLLSQVASAGDVYTHTDQLLAGMR